MSDDVVHADTDLDVEPRVVWDEIVTGDWLGADVEMPLKVGEEGQVHDGEQTRVLVVEEIVEGQRLVFRWASFADPPSRVVVELRPIDGGTHVSVTEQPLVITMRSMAGCS